MFLTLWLSTSIQQTDCIDVSGDGLNEKLKPEKNTSCLTQRRRERRGRPVIALAFSVLSYSALSASQVSIANGREAAFAFV